MKRSIILILVLALTPATWAKERSAAKPRGAQAGDAEKTEELTLPPRNTKEFRQFTKMVDAAERGDLKTVRLLLRRGVDPDGKNAGDGLAPTNRPLLWAAKRGDLAMVDVLLKAGANPDWCCCSCISPLHEAIINKYPKVVERLLEAGSNPRLLYDSSVSPLDLATKTGDEDIVEILRRRLTSR